MKEMKAKKCMPDDKIPATDCTHASTYVGSQLVSDQSLISAVSHQPCHQLCQVALKSLMICRLLNSVGRETSSELLRTLSDRMIPHHNL